MGINSMSINAKQEPKFVFSDPIGLVLLLWNVLCGKVVMEQLFCSEGVHGVHYVKNEYRHNLTAFDFERKSISIIT